VLPPLRAERGRIENELASLGGSRALIRMHPRAADAYLAAIARLGSALGEGDREASRTEVRKLIERVVVTPGEHSPTIRLDGWLSSVAFGDLPIDPRLGGRVVAGERYRASPQDVRLPFSLQIGETA
jgi:hypothetical protein